MNSTKEALYKVILQNTQVYGSIFNSGTFTEKKVELVRAGDYQEAQRKALAACGWTSSASTGWSVADIMKVE